MGEGDRTSIFQGDPRYPKEERLGQARGGLGTALTMERRGRRKPWKQSLPGTNRFIRDGDDIGRDSHGRHATGR